MIVMLLLFSTSKTASDTKILLRIKELTDFWIRIAHRVK